VYQITSRVRILILNFVFSYQMHRKELNSLKQLFFVGG